MLCSKDLKSVLGTLVFHRTFEIQLDSKNIVHFYHLSIIILSNIDEVFVKKSADELGINSNNFICVSNLFFTFFSW